MTERDELENELYNGQYVYIQQNYGQDAADAANYGWGVDECDDVLHVSTKVYGHGVIESQLNYLTKEISHDG